MTLMLPRPQGATEQCAANGCPFCRFFLDERRDGPRYVEAIRGARAMRRRVDPPFRDGNYGTGAYLNERLCGIPEEWAR